MRFQLDRLPRYESIPEKREYKRALVCAGRAHAAVVFDGDRAVGWCPFGGGSEIAPLKEFKSTDRFVDRKYRGQGIASLALEGALGMIAASDGGLVEAYPERTEGRNVSGAYVCLGTTAMFERRGFARQRPVAKHHWVMIRTVEASSPTP